MSNMFRTHLLSLLLAFLIANGKAQSDPDSAPLPAKNQPLKSKVYQGPQWGSGSSLQNQSLASGGTTHLKSLSIEAIILKDKLSTALDPELDSEKLIIVKEGVLSLSTGGHQKKVGPGSVALILPGDHYGVQNLSSSPAVYYLLKYHSKAPDNQNRGRQAGGSFIVDWDEVEYREHDKGGRRDFFDRPTAMCEDFEMHVTNLNENTSSHDPHTHEVEEIILMVEGKISMHIDGKEIEAGPGDFAFVDSNVPHAPTNIGSGQAIYFAFQWK